MNRSLIIQHIFCEPAGLIEEVLQENDFEIDNIKIYNGDHIPEDIEAYDNIVIMGGPMNVQETENFPFLRQERNLIELALEDSKPILGICLGAQLLAQVLGSKIEKIAVPELGYHPIEINRTNAPDSIFNSVPSRANALHWHYQAFDLPKSAIHLASSDLTPNQAFCYDDSAYGLLFHLEASPDQVNMMVREFDSIDLVPNGINPEEVMQDSKKYYQETRVFGGLVFQNWVDLSFDD